jgi:hypothetical protein
MVIEGEETGMIEEGQEKRIANGEGNVRGTSGGVEVIGRNVRGTNGDVEVISNKGKPDTAGGEKIGEQIWEGKCKGES